MCRAILECGAVMATGDETCILFFYLMDPKHRLGLDALCQDFVGSRSFAVKPAVEMPIERANAASRSGDGGRLFEVPCTSSIVCESVRNSWQVSGKNFHFLPFIMQYFAVNFRFFLLNR